MKLTKEMIIEICEMIKNGVVDENGEVKECCLTDYYKKTNMPLSIFYKRVKNLKDEEMDRVFLEFFNKHKGVVKTGRSKDKLLEEKIVIEGVVLTYEVKCAIFSIMEEYNMPLSNVLFKEIATKYILTKNYEKLINSSLPEYSVENRTKKDNVLKVVDGIKNGVTLKSGKVVDFELLDYFLITSVPLFAFKYSMKGCSKEQRGIFNSFYMKNFKKDTCLNNKRLFSTNYIFGNKTLSNEEVNDIVEFMVSNRLPMFIAIFNQIARRYVMGELDLVSSKMNYSEDPKVLRRVFKASKKYDDLKESRGRSLGN